MIMFTSDIEYIGGTYEPHKEYTQKNYRDFTPLEEICTTFSKKQIFAGAVESKITGFQRKIIYVKDFEIDSSSGPLDLIYDRPRFNNDGTSSGFHIVGSICLAPLIQLEQFDMNKKWQLSREIKKIYNHFLYSPEQLEKMKKYYFAPYYDENNCDFENSNVIPDAGYYEHLKYLSSLVGEVFTNETKEKPKQLIKVKR